MKTTAILFLAFLALCVQCSVPENKSTKKEISTQPIKVGVLRHKSLSDILLVCLLVQMIKYGKKQYHI